DHRLPVDLIHKEDRGRWAPAAQLAYSKLDNGAAREGELRVRDAAGYWRGLAIREVVIRRDTDNAARWLLGTGVEINKRTLNTEQTGSFASFPEENPQPVLRVSQAGTLLYANPAGYRLLACLGWATEGPVPAALGRLARQTRRAGNNQYLDLECGGRHFHITSVKIPGRAYANLYALDSTAEAYAYAQQRSAEHRFQALIEHTADGFALVDAKGNIRYVGPENVTVLGFPRDESLNLSIFDRVHPDDADRAQQILSQILHSPGQPMRFEIRACHRDGSWRWLEIVATNRLADPDIEAITVNYRDVSQRKQAESRLREQAMLVDQVSDAIIAVDNDLLIRAWNRAAEQIYGWRELEVLGKPVHEIIRSEFSSGNSDSALQQVIRDGIWHGEITQYHRDGHPIQVLSSVNVLLDDQGNVTGLAAVHKDITERKRSEEALQESEQILRTFLNALPESAMLIDGQGKVLVANEAAARLVGSELADLQGTVLADFFRPGMVKEPLSQISAALRSGQSARFIAEIDDRMLDYYLYPTLDKDGQLARVAIVSVDVTEQERALAALAASENRLSTLFQEAPIGICFTRFGMILDANRTYVDMFGYTESHEIVGRSVLELTAPNCRAFVDATIKKRLREPGRQTFETTGLRRDGSTFPLMISNASVQLPDGPASIAFVLDMTGRKAAEEALAQERALLAKRVKERTAELQAANLELARASRLKDEFLANMSHELRTPLQAILGLSENLMTLVPGPLNEKQLQYARLIEESGRHLLELINDILDYSKIEAGKLEPELSYVSVANICRAGLQLVGSQATRKSLKTSVNVDEQVDIIQADERILKQMLVNLLSNAVKFTPDGGQIGIEVTGDEEAGMVRFTVWDTGIGITAEDFPRLFQPFVQLEGGLNRHYAGTGLGLALVARLAALHGGAVGVESTSSQGSRFTVSLPWQRYAPAAQQVLPVTESPSALPATDAVGNGRGQTKILLIDDTKASIVSILDVLTVAGYRVIIAETGQDGVRLAASFQPDLILMDIQMPDMDGISVTRQIRDLPKLRAIPIVALTALAMPGDRERCLAAGMDGYLSKPVSNGHLLDTVRSCLHVRNN
ncbi:MAG: PAS domain S-box protein, partial [Caldilineaceae bacterium]|nr:PAS domain S-box protein [Caldilineaceae bacterium]